MIPKYSDLLVLCYSLLSISPKHVAERLVGDSGKRPTNQFPGQWQGSFADPQNAADDSFKDVPKIICYYSVPPKEMNGEIDAISSLCTHVIFDGAKLKNNELTVIEYDYGWKDDIAAMQRKGLKVMIKIAGWAEPFGSEPHPSGLLVGNREHRAKFLQSVKTCLDSYKFDGFEVDWRYPKYRKVEPNDTSGFELLIEELSREFKKREKLLSSTGVAWDHTLDGYDVPKLIQYFDWITLLTFHYRGNWDSRMTSTHSPLYKDPVNGEGNTNYTVYSWMNGNNTYRSKLVITVPSVGVLLKLRNANRNGIGDYIIQAGTRAIPFNKLCWFISKKKWTYVPDRYLRIGAYAFFDDQWASFNDPAMAEEKGRYANELGLGGVAVYNVEGDDRDNACDCRPYPLLRAINIGIGRLRDSMENCRFTYQSLPSKPEYKNAVMVGIVTTVIWVLLLLFTSVLFKKRRKDAKKMRPITFVGRRRIDGNAVIKKTETGLEVRRDESDRNRMWVIGAVETGWRNCEKTDSEWEVSRNSVKMLEILGTGFFGQVWKCSLQDFRSSSGETLAAVKTLKEVATDNNRHELLAEVEVMKRLGSHPHVVSFLGCCTDRDPVLVLLEYVPGGKLQTYLRKSRGKHEYCNLHGVSSLTSTELIDFGCQAARGMEYLSSQGIVHRDLAARNILIDDNTKKCKVADFGLARDLEDGLVYEKKSDGKIPIRWLPPESLYDNVFTTKSDVWSFGVLLWEIVALGSTPYPGLSASEVLKRILKGYRLEKPEYCGDELYDIMQWCWKENPEERPSFSEIVQCLENLLESGLEYINLKEVDDNYQFTDVAENSEEKV